MLHVKSIFRLTSEILYQSNYKCTINKGDGFDLFSQCTRIGNHIKKRRFQSVENKFKNDLCKDETRFNELDLQMLSKNLYNQIFGIDHLESYDTNEISSIKKQLSNIGITNGCTSQIPDINVSIPTLQGQNIEDHFKQIANDQLQPYLKIISKLLNKLPPVPEHFVLQEGWTRYSNCRYEAIDYPEEDGLIFDVEVCVKNGPLPVLATGVSTSSWYSWVSKYLIDGISSRFINKDSTPQFLIPLESTNNNFGFNSTNFQQIPKIVVGHNISFDRIRLKEQYWLNGNTTRFLDTMALHICISGTCSYQRAILKSKNLNVPNDKLNSVASLNSLADVYKLYCGAELDKTSRNLFLNQELHEIKDKFNELISYCAKDVIATHEILKNMFPMFVERFPHPATLVGMLELGSSYLPINYNWKRYLEEAETTYEDLYLESKVCLSKRADRVCRLSISGRYKNDPWMWDEDWSIKDITLRKGYDYIYFRQKEKFMTVNMKSSLKLKFKYLYQTKAYLPKRMPCMPGYPNWYRKLCEKQKINVNLFPKAQKISTSMLVTPKLLNLTWQNCPLHYIKEYGWGFLVPNKCESFSTNLPLKEIVKHSRLDQCSSYEKIITCFNYKPHANLDNCCYFFKLPHRNGIFFNVGNPLAKDFLDKFSENILASVDINALRILEISKMTSYWKNNRDRIMSQLAIWLDGKQNDSISTENSFANFGAIIPQVVVSGTLTRRAVEPTWMTASNALCDRVGSELRAMISAPSNYSFVGADVDSQELWIASIIGDAYSNKVKIQGATPFSWMTLIGNKSQGTDMHSVTAKAIGISRDQAKIINYARIYGAGQKFAEQLLKQFNPTLSDKEAFLKSRKMFLMTKGQKCYRLKNNYVSKYFIDKLYTKHEAFKIAQTYGRSIMDIFEKGRWYGGSESTMFNSLEEIAEQINPATPFLNARLSRALEKENNEKYLPTKINWVVQSSAVDFLHLILVNMRWLMKDKAKLCLSFHDEVHYLVPSKYKYNAALAMHITNLLVRCFFVSKLNMKDLPMSVAFFNTVEIDSVLRKEAKQDCKTPSNPHGLLEGYGIHYGESLDIWSAVEKSEGCVGIIN